MAYYYEALKLFISSPGDVKEERKIVEDVIHNINITSLEAFGLTIEVESWEKEHVPNPNISNLRFQEFLNKKVEKCDIFLLILNKRYGSMKPGQDMSNTEREISVARRAEKEIVFLSYFKMLKRNDDKGAQQKRVEKLRNQLIKMDMINKDYKTLEEFRELVTHGLYKVLIDHRMSTRKINSTRNFWQFGIADRPTPPNVVIVYPPVDMQLTKNFNSRTFWLSRLVPNVVFEDYKALQKLEKSFWLIGMRNYRIYSNAEMPDDLCYRNIIWLCIPRNNFAISQLEKYKDIALFRFLPRQSNPESSILWRNKPNGKFFKINSPLSTYLSLQRDGQSGGAWDAKKGKIIAKDFAVLARFKRPPETGIDVVSGHLHDYFLAGIRGLGTWGAGWFIDRSPSLLSKFKESDDIQLLLEVTYKNGRITTVKDVSNQNEKYFEAQLSKKLIRDEIEKYTNTP